MSLSRWKEILKISFVFAFSSPFCYAKTAFSYSPDILSPCTPDLFMVKDVVNHPKRDDKHVVRQ